jgi:hypothetical protein
MEPGHPYARLGAADPAWSWRGGWTQDKETGVSRGSGRRSHIAFNGVAVAVVGR